MLLDLMCWYFVGNFCIHFHEKYWFVTFFSHVVSLSGFGIRVLLLASQNKVGSASYPIFLKALTSKHSFFSKSLIECSGEGIRAWIFVHFIYTILFIAQNYLYYSFIIVFTFVKLIVMSLFHFLF